MYGSENYHEAGFTPSSIPPASRETRRRATLIIGICFISLLVSKSGTKPIHTHNLGTVKPFVRPNKLQHSIIMKTLLNGTESSQFLNDMCEVMWPFISIAASALVEEIVEPMFEDLLPGPLKKTKFVSIDLGSNAMKFDHIDVLNRSANSIKLHIDTIWEGKVKIELKSPMIAKYGVKKIRLRGRVSILMKPLVPVMPVLSAMQIGYINPPSLEMDFSGVANVADNSLLKGSVMKVVNDVMGSLFVLPNRFLLPILPSNNFFDTYELPIGVLKLTLLNGTGFKTQGSIFRDVPDMYIQIAVGGEKKQLSKVVENSNNPIWVESFDFIYSDAEQIVKIESFDKDLDKDDYMGGAEVSAHQLIHANGKHLELPLKIGEKDMNSHITFSSEVRELSTDKKNFEIGIRNGDDILGLMSVIVAGASNITERPNLSSHAKVILGDRQFVTPVVKKMIGVDPKTPMYNSIFMIPLTRELFEKRPEVKLQLYNGSKLHGEKTVSFEEVMNETDMKWRRDLKMDEEAVLHVMVRLSGLSYGINSIE